MRLPEKGWTHARLHSQIRSTNLTGGLASPAILLLLSMRRTLEILSRYSFLMISWSHNASKHGKVIYFKFVSISVLKHERQTFQKKTTNNVYSTYQCDHETLIFMTNG